MNYTVKLSNSPEELKEILFLRYEILRKPWNQPASTATDDLESASFNAYIADENGTIIACARLQENENKAGQIRFMAVREDQQGKGLGKLLVRFLEEKAKEKNLKRIELQARENAVHFYKNCGYKIEKETFLLWDIIQHYLMAKNV
jgi:N-acetylglutamate synthase-like GNAT family acetyltransferase